MRYQGVGFYKSNDQSVARKTKWYLQQLLEDQQNEDQGPWLLGVAMLRTHVIDDDSFLSGG